MQATDVRITDENKMNLQMKTHFYKQQNNSSCQMVRKKAVEEAMVYTHQFICCLRVLIKEKWCEAFSWVNVYYATRVGNGAVG